MCRCASVLMCAFTGVCACVLACFTACQRFVSYFKSI